MYFPPLLYKPLAASLLLSLLAGNAAYADCIDAADTPSRLSQMLDRIPESRQKSGWYEVSGSLCVSVIWTGELRPVAQQTAHFLDNWIVQMGVAPRVRDAFETEIQVSEHGQSYWLVIQENLMDGLRQDVVAESQVTLQVKRFGAISGGPQVFGIQGLAAGATQITHAVPKPTNPSEVLRDLVQNHPRVEIREELNQWIEQARVSLSFKFNVDVSEMSVALWEVNGAYTPVLFMNTKWMLGSDLEDPKRDRRYKELVLYHEYSHLRDHFDNVIPIDPLGVDVDYVENNLEAFAEKIWKAEYRATFAEWELARELGVLSLMPRYPKEVNQLEFLDAFYAVFSKSEANISDERLLPRLRAVWKKIYAREKKQMHRPSL